MACGSQQYYVVQPSSSATTGLKGQSQKDMQQICLNDDEEGVAFPQRFADDYLLNFNVGKLFIRKKFTLVFLVVGRGRGERGRPLRKPSPFYQALLQGTSDFKFVF